MSSRTTEQIIARQPPEVQTIIRLLLTRIAELERENAELRARIEQLERQAKGKTPQNSSQSRCGTRCGNCPRSSRSSPSTGGTG